jgi:hypothetical protein
MGRTNSVLAADASLAACFAHASCSSGRVAGAIDRPHDGQPGEFSATGIAFKPTAIELGKGEASAEPEGTLIIELVKHNSEIWMRKSAPRKFAG